MIEKEEKLFYGMLLAMLLWGGGWIALKVLTPLAPLEVITFWRFFIMLIAFVPVLMWQKKPLQFSKKSLKYATLSAVFNILFMVFAFLGIKEGLAGSGSMIITVLSPLFTFVLAAFIFKHRFSNRELLGLFIGLIGGAIMLFGKGNGFLEGGYAFYLLAALLWAAVTIVSQKAGVHVDPIQYSFIIALIGTIFLLVVTFKYDIFIVFNQGFLFWIALIYLGVLGQTVATTIYYTASKHLGSAKSSSFMFVVPLSALFFGVTLLGEPLEVSVLLGGGLGLIAVFMISKKSKKSR